MFQAWSSEEIRKSVEKCADESRYWTHFVALLRHHGVAIKSAGEQFFFQSFSSDEEFSVPSDSALETVLQKLYANWLGYLDEANKWGSERDAITASRRAWIDFLSTQPPIFSANEETE